MSIPIDPFSFIILQLELTANTSVAKSRAAFLGAEDDDGHYFVGERRLVGATVRVQHDVQEMAAKARSTAGT